MVKNHLKRISTPKTWNIKKKKNTFILRPEPSGHSMKESVSITMLFRDLLKKAKTTKEMKYILAHKEILLNNVKVTSYKASVGLMDVISIPETKEHFRMIYDSKMQLTVKRIEEKEANLVPMMIKNKTMITGGKMQLNFSNGRNLLVDKDEYKTNQVLIVDCAKQKIAEVLSLEKDALVYFTSGKHTGNLAVVEEIKEDSIVFKQDEEVFEADTKHGLGYMFVIGKKNKASINLAD